MGNNEEYFVDVNDLSIDVFDVVEQGGAVTALTADHGMPEVGSSTNCFCYICCSCSSN
ncbi:thiomuracin/GE37468 family thiazolyl RiPP peptide [Streptomyces sp. NPDC046915]|uniref:thiomuracin/GE37468 family thiazolyl RiPP peptide n=1 Tax=Streptomyces sp. NPDC046915 TaxID=3155257 RepID=UPI0033C452FD